MRQSPQQLGGRGRLFSHPNQNHRDSRLSMCMARDFSRCLEQTTDSGASTAETLGSSLLTWTKPTGSGRSTSGNRCALLHRAPQYQCHSHSMLCCLACSPHGVVLSRPVLPPFRSHAHRAGMATRSQLWRQERLTRPSCQPTTRRSIRSHGWQHRPRTNNKHLNNTGHQARQPNELRDNAMGFTDFKIYRPHTLFFLFRLFISAMSISVSQESVMRARAASKLHAKSILLRSLFEMESHFPRRVGF
jgi:hypothetical protein